MPSSTTAISTRSPSRAHPDADVRRLAGVRDGVVQQVAHRGDQQVVLAEHARAPHRRRRRAARAWPPRWCGRGRRPPTAPVSTSTSPTCPSAPATCSRDSSMISCTSADSRVGLRLHPAREPAHRLGVVGGVLDRLGQQRQRAHRRLELVRHVDDEVAPDGLEASRLRQVLRQHDEVVGADLRDPHLDHAARPAPPGRAAPRAPRRGSRRRAAPARSGHGWRPGRSGRRARCRGRAPGRSPAPRGRTRRAPPPPSAAPRACGPARRRAPAPAAAARRAATARSTGTPGSPTPPPAARGRRRGGACSPSIPSTRLTLGRAERCTAPIGRPAPGRRRAFTGRSPGPLVRAAPGTRLSRTSPAAATARRR